MEPKTNSSRVSVVQKSHFREYCVRPIERHAHQKIVEASPDASKGEKIKAMKKIPSMSA